jgi:hypothetical protein
MTLHADQASQRSKLDRRFDKVHPDEPIGWHGQRIPACQR